MENMDIKRLKEIMGENILYLGNPILVHEAADFFQLKDNSGRNIKNIWLKIQYRLNKIMKEDKTLIKSKIKCITYFGKQDREIWHICYYFKKEDKNV